MRIYPSSPTQSVRKEKVLISSLIWFIPLLVQRLVCFAAWAAIWYPTWRPRRWTTSVSLGRPGSPEIIPLQVYSPLQPHLFHCRRSDGDSSLLRNRTPSCGCEGEEVMKGNKSLSNVWTLSSILFNETFVSKLVYLWMGQISTTRAEGYYKAQRSKRKWWSSGIFFMPHPTTLGACGDDSRCLLKQIRLCAALCLIAGVGEIENQTSDFFFSDIPAARGHDELFVSVLTSSLPRAMAGLCSVSVSLVSEAPAARANVSTRRAHISRRDL